MKLVTRLFVIAALTTSVAVSGSLAPSGAATSAVIDEGWLPSRNLSGAGLQAVRFRDVAEYNERISTLLSSTPYWKECSSITTAPCSTAENIDFSSILQPCESDSQLDCVVEFGTINADNEKVRAEYVRAFPTTAVNEYPAEPSVGLPAGKTGGLWNVSADSGAPIRLHYLGAMVNGRATPGERVTFNNFYAMLSPVAMDTFPCSDAASGCSPSYLPEVSPGAEPDAVYYADGFGTNDGFDCVMSGNRNSVTNRAECAVRKAISKDIRYYLTVRLSQAVSGWMHGRMAEPDISISDVAGVSGAVTISVSAKAVSLPAVDIEKRWQDLTPTLQEAYRDTGGWKGATPSSYGSNAFAQTPELRTKESRPTSFGPTSIEELEAWLPVVEDKAVADLSTWTVRSLGRNELGAAEGCIGEGNTLAGIVSTNATVYKAAAPIYDPETGSLSYTVAAPHYMSSGDLFNGAYSLIVRSDIARCIYNLDSSPITSTIEVIATDGQKATATTNVTEENGWIKFVASGFTHSTPTIRAKMSQAPKASPATETKAPAASAPTETKVPETTAPKDTLPRVAKGRSVKSTQLAKWAGLKTTKKSRVTLKVTKPSRKVCRTSGSSIRVSAVGTCTVVIKVQTGTKKATKQVSFIAT